METVLSIVTDDEGGVEIEFGNEPVAGLSARAQQSKHGDNLAETMDDADLSLLSMDLLEGIDADISSRSEWMANYNECLAMLGLKIEKSTDGRSTVRDPTLLHSIIRFQAQARGELLPASGPVKVRVDGEPSDEANQRADDLENDMNHYLTTVATEYYPDTDRGLFYLGFGGNIFKKVYRCPIRQRPVSECVYVSDLIVSQDATDLSNAERVTHRIEMSRYRMQQMQDSGVYVKEELTTPIASPTPVDQAEAQISGIAAAPTRVEDAQFTVYETLVRLNPARYGLGDDETLQPFKVSIEKDSRRVLEVRRNWLENDERKRQKKFYVKYGLIPGMGFLDYGFAQILGNTTRTLTAVLRLMIDAGMFANFPGGVRKKGARMETNEIRPGPGQFVEIDTGDMPVQDAIMAMPFAGPNAELLQLYTGIKEEANALAGAVSIETGDGRTNVPVGTIMAQIEQQTQIITAVHKRLHQAQQEEFILLKALFAEDPEAIWRGAEKPKRQWSAEEQFADLNLVPASDPNVPAHVHRLMQATALEMLSSAHPELYNQYQVQRRINRVIGTADMDEVLIDPDTQQQDPMADPMAQLTMAQLMLDQEKQRNKLQTDLLNAKLKEQDLKLRAIEKQAALKQAEAELASRTTQAEADRKSRERIAAMGDQSSIINTFIKEAGQDLRHEPASPDPVNDSRYGP